MFFRDWTVATAREVGVTGWVRNRRDGSVEALAMGDQAAVDRLIEQLHHGSPASRVVRVTVDDAAPEAVEGFRRAPTV